MEPNEISAGEAADLLAAARKNQLRARRTVNFGWLIALLAGLGMLVEAMLDAAGVAQPAQALSTGVFVLGVGLLAKALFRRNHERFATDVPEDFAFGFIIGIAMSSAVLVYVFNGNPPPAGGTFAVSVGLAAMGIVFLFRRDERWIAPLALATAAVVALGQIVAPDSFGPRRAIVAVALLGYAGITWWRTGR
jgi:hypothetical protein